MKASRVFQLIDKRADPLVVKVIMDLAADLHELKKEHGQTLASIGELASTIGVLAQGMSEVQDVVEAIVKKTGVHQRSREEFASEPIDDVITRYKG